MLLFLATAQMLDYTITTFTYCLPLAQAAEAETEHNQDSSGSSSRSSSIHTRYSMFSASWISYM